MHEKGAHTAHRSPTTHGTTNNTIKARKRREKKTHKRKKKVNKLQQAVCISAFDILLNTKINKQQRNKLKKTMKKRFYFSLRARFVFGIMLSYSHWLSLSTIVDESSLCRFMSILRFFYCFYLFQTIYIYIFRCYFVPW